VIDVPAGLPASAFLRATNYLSAMAQGRTIDEVQQLLTQEVTNLRRELDDVSARLVQDGVAVWSGADASEGRSLIVRGQANLLDNTGAVQDLERMRRLFEDIENKRDLAELMGLAEKADGVRIFIGSENRLFSLSGSSLVAAPLRNEQEKIVGVLGIIGPTRLNYARIIPMVDYTAKAVGRLLS
jgi:heat-inducible transcriptional repressor